MLGSSGVRDRKDNFDQQKLELHVPLLCPVSQSVQGCFYRSVFTSGVCLQVPRCQASRLGDTEGKHCRSGRILKSGFHLPPSTYVFRLLLLLLQVLCLGFMGTLCEKDMVDCADSVYLEPVFTF